MRHSDPKLTANIYTHTLVSDKADELAKLPVISARKLGAAENILTGTDSVPFLQVGNSADKPADSNGSDFDRQTTTYNDGETFRNVMSGQSSEYEKAPVSQRKTGAFYSGDHDGTRTRNLQIDSLKSSNSYHLKILMVTKMLKRRCHVN